MLPHFLMLLVGKPGSGKTSLLRQMLTNTQLYKDKFDETLVVSPSFAKMDLEVSPQNATTKFSLDWIFQKLDQINEKQQSNIYGHSFGGQKLMQNRAGTKSTENTGMMNDQRSRFQMQPMFKMLSQAESMPTNSLKTRQSSNKMVGSAVNELMNNSNIQAKPEQQQYLDDPQVSYLLQQQQIIKDIEQMDQSKKEETHANILIVLDDVVNQVKKSEFDPRLAQLVMNRRHLILNGTVSIIMVTQKYTLIPARVRSNANWLVLFQLNPADFDLVYRDVVLYDQKTWASILDFVFKGGDKDKEEEGKGLQDYLKNKKFDNLGIWVEYNVYFTNFKRIKTQ